MKPIKNHKSPLTKVSKISKELDGEMKKRDSSFLLGIEMEAKVILTLLKSRKKVINNYNLKFCYKDMEYLNLQTIKSLYTENKLKYHKKIKLSGIDREMELFSTHTTCRPDALLPLHLKSEKFKLYIK